MKILSAPMNKPSHTTRFLIFFGVAPMARITPISRVRSRMFMLMVDINPSVPTSPINMAIAMSEFTNTFMCAAMALCSSQTGIVELTETFSFSNKASTSRFLCMAFSLERSA